MPDTWPAAFSLVGITWAIALVILAVYGAEKKEKKEK